MRQDAAADAARLFTLFFDRFHVSVAGSYRANKPIVETLDKVIGPDDMVGVMTPEMSPGAITYSRRTSSIERMITDNWAWGIKDQVAQLSPRESGFEQCYPPNLYPGIAAKMIARLREQQTLDALDGLVTHLEGLRPERKFVMIFTEGWPLYQRDETAGRRPRRPGAASRTRSAPIRSPAASAGPARPTRGAACRKVVRGVRARARSCWRSSITRSSSASCCSAPIAPTSASIRSTRAG